MKNNPIAIDLYSGLGGWAEGLLAHGYYVVGFDIERHEYGDQKYPAQLVIQDVLTLHGSQFKDASLIVASPPCFVAETLILTDRGLVTIPEVRVGDFVLTHRGRWRKVLKTGSTLAPTLTASGYGGTLEGTSEHPIYARQNEGGFSVWDKEAKAPFNVLKSLGEPAWLPLGDMQGSYWASPTEFEALPMPELPNSLPSDPDFWWIVGRWVGDGWVRLREGQGDEVIICCSRDEADELGRRLAAFAPRQGRRVRSGELHWRKSEERTTTRFTAASNSLAKWLVRHFGRGAANKALPAWTFGMPAKHRAALLDGYASADGYHGKNSGASVVKASSVSRRLAIGVRFLAASIGHTSNLFYTRRPPTARIEGRTINQRDIWTATWNLETGSNRHVDMYGGHQWGVVRSVGEAQTSARVWNIEVEQDNSYTANGIVVHNCQEFSYMAMPWSRAKQIRRALLGEDEFPEGYTGSRTREELTKLFDACFRIQREASEAAGHHIPLIVENVRGAQKWVGRANWNFGSFYLWGDVPALMPMVAKRAVMKHGIAHRPGGATNFHRNLNNGVKVASESGRRTDPGKGARFTSRDCGVEGVKFSQSGAAWFDGTPRDAMLGNQGPAAFGSKSKARKAASAMIAKIPFTLSSYIAEVFKPKGETP